MVDLRQLAAELGYSLLVRTSCWECSCLVYLLAKPDGGFVILDDLGPDWPVHPCYQHDNRNRSYRSLHAYDPNYRVPIPANIKWNNTLRAGQRICATIVKVDGRKSILCDGKYLYRLLIRGPGRIGECIEGGIMRIGSQWGLQVIGLIECPDELLQ
jgi:hypothetical protein